MVTSLFFFSFFTYCSSSNLENGEENITTDELIDDGITYAAVFEKLKKGVNQDVSMPQGGPWVKVQHERGHMQAIKQAGFESVRIFMPYSSNLAEYEVRIQDALDYDLAVVVCLWGHYQWNSKNIDTACAEIGNFWKNIAQKWSGKFSNQVVFEILNEPAGIGFPETRNADVMKLYNTAIKLIRAEDEDRPVLVSSGGHNDADQMDGYVNDTHLDYTLENGTGFFEDPNVGVAIHFYAPRHEDGVNFAMWTASLSGNWRRAIDKHINKAVEWQEKHSTNKPVVVTEWGAWIFESRTNSADFPQWLDYYKLRFDEQNFGSMWYTGIQNNQRHFGIFDSELGWNQVVLNTLTGVTSPGFPGTNQLIDSEFTWNSGTWNLTSSKVTKAHVGNGALSGSNSLKLTVPNTGDYKMYQQTITDVINGEPLAPGRTLLHLLKGETYEISFMAKTSSGVGEIKVALKDVNNLSTVFYQSEAQTISNTVQTFTMLYTHTEETAMDIRFEFDLGSKQQTLILDKIVLKRK